jgi:ferredoxin-NADP reductase
MSVPARRIHLLGGVDNTRGGNRAVISMTETLPMKERLRWKPLRIVEATVETTRTKTLVIEVPGWQGHRPGQHVDVRLTKKDGYWVQRSYSIASSPEKERLTLLIGRAEDGTLSSCLVDDPQGGADKVELRGPIGINFAWEPHMDGPLLLVAGGCGIAPLMSMIRCRTAHGDHVKTRLLYSSRSLDDIAYRDELDRLAKADESLEVFHTLTRTQPTSWTGYRRRIDMEMLEEVAWRPEEIPLIFICGPTPLVKRVATELVELGYKPARINRPRASYRR